MSKKVPISLAVDTADSLLSPVSALTEILASQHIWSDSDISDLNGSLMHTIPTNINS